MLYVVRHGETDWNVQRRVQGRTNIKLNANGVRQAEELAKHTKKLPIDVCICSPLDRAAQTAKIIFDGETIFDDRLLERYYGEIEGKWPKEWAGAWRIHNPVEVAFESVLSVYSRVKDILDEIRTKYAGKNVLIVAHGGVIICIRAYFEGIPESGDLHDLPKTGNCEILSYQLKG